MTEQPSESDGFRFLPYFYVVWVSLVGFIVYAKLSLWLYSVLVFIGVLAYFGFDELYILCSIFLLFAFFASLVMNELQKELHQNNKSDMSGILRIYDIDGKEQVHGQTRPTHLGHHPPLTYDRWPEQTDISLLISKPGGVAPDICFDICPPNGRTGHVDVVKLPHEGEKNMCLQIQLGRTWKVEGKSPVGDQHYWGRLCESHAKEEKENATDASNVDEKK